MNDRATRQGGSAAASAFQAFLGPDREVGMSRATNGEILRFALAKAAFVVTLDADFHAILAVSGAVGPSETDSLQLLDYSLIDKLQTYIRAQGAGNPLDVGELNAFAAKAGHRNGAALRHTLWLLKYGLLREV
jgi:hypothetical protein